MTDLDEYKAMIASRCSPGFSPEEIVNLTPRKQLPPRSMWKNILDAIDVANVLRIALISRGGSGLLVRAAYRPIGGAANSAHKTNRALDLDVIPSDVKRCKDEGIDLLTAFAEEATKVWAMLGYTYRMGLGLYGPKGREWTWRVHVDSMGIRTWQHSGENKVHPPAAITICRRLGLDPPSAKKSDVAQ